MNKNNLQVRKVIRRSVKIGFYIQEKYPEIIERLRSGESRRDIIRDIAKEDEFLDENKFSVLETAMKYAYLGNDDGENGIIYSGLIGSNEYLALAKKQIAKQRSDFGKRVKRMGVGSWATSERIHRERGRKIAVERGEVPWSGREIITAYGLRVKYRETMCHYYKAIADELNFRFHKGKPVRKRKNVDSMFKNRAAKRKKRLALENKN